MRISRDEMLMNMAFEARKRSTCLRRQVGAIIAIDGRPITTGYNGAPEGLPHCTPETCSSARPCVDTAHAEANAIAFAARHGTRIGGATIYTTASPCRGCAILLINAGILRVVYEEEYRDITPIAKLREARLQVDRIVLRANQDT